MKFIMQTILSILAILGLTATTAQTVGVTSQTAQIGVDAESRTTNKSIVDSSAFQAVDMTSQKSKCIAECKQLRSEQTLFSGMCVQTKNVRPFPAVYHACLGGERSAFHQACTLRCDASVETLPFEELSSSFYACTKYKKGHRETFNWCRRGYDANKERLSTTLGPNIVEDGSVEESTEDVLALSYHDAPQELVQAKTAENTLHVTNHSTAIIEVGSIFIGNESESDLWYSQQPHLEVSSSQHRAATVDITDSLSFEAELVPTPGEEFPSEVKNSVELQGGVTGSEASTSKKVSLPFYMLGWRPQHISAVSNHDTKFQLQTRADMGGHIIEEFNYGGKDSAWNIYLMCLTHIHVEFTHRTLPSHHELFASSDGGEAVASIQATQAVDPCQLIDTGPSGRLLPSNSFIEEVIWMSCRLCVEEPLWLDPSIDMLDIWERLPVKHEHIKEHSQLSIDLRIELPPCELISAAGITCSFEPPLDMYEGSLGRTLFGKIDGSSCEVLRLHLSVSMLVNLFDAPLEFNIKEAASPITVEVIASIDVLVDIDTIRHLFSFVQPDTLESAVSAVNSLNKPICGCMNKGHVALWVVEKDIDHMLIVEAFFNQVIVISEEAMRLIQSHTEMNMTTLLGGIIPAERERGSYFDLLPDSTSVDNCVSVDVKVYIQNYLAMVITLVKQVLAVSFDASTSLFGSLLKHHATTVMPFVLLLCVSISLIGACGKDHASRGVTTENSDSYSASATTDEAFVTRNIAQDPQIQASVELEPSLTLSAADKDSSAKATVTFIEVDAPQELSKVKVLTYEFDGHSDSMPAGDHHYDSTAVQVHDALTGLDHPSFIAYICNLLSFDVWSLRESIFYELLALMLSMLVYHIYNPACCAIETDDVALSFGSVTSPGANWESEKISNAEVISTDGDNELDFILPGNTNVIQPLRRELIALRSELGSHWNSPSKRRVRRSSRTRSRPQYFQPT